MIHTTFHGLTPVQGHVATSLAAGASLTSAAESANVGRTTIYDWLNNSMDFSAAVEQARSEFVLILRDQLRDASVKALATITAILDDPTAPAAVRLKAALAILNRPHFPDPGWHLPEKIGPPMQEELSAQIAFLKADTRCAEKEAALVHAAAQAEFDRTKPNSSEQKNANSLPAPSEPTRTNPNTSEQKNKEFQPAVPVHSNKVGRNEPCSCGSGRKYKRCCLGKTQNGSC